MLQTVILYVQDSKCAPEGKKNASPVVCMVILCHLITPVLLTIKLVNAV